ncbi:ExbD/TolR family protein [Prevotella koreensis]|uniref:Biopolymer transporter ExbD n=1 Tax=Prevotella koreensis TaxID=2490854 RepID=A0A3S0PDA9_9BACT|nr:biopolymer transporter ExbD [Prevotella koreensis]RUL60030.1 biopolymer transporter ExbD [Prevotella koreensis]
MAQKKESKQKKMNVRVDFTPMVDMLMLLITFFMLCTTLSKPSTMELTMPSNDDTTQEEQKNEAKASQTVTIYLAANNKIYYVEYDDEGNAKELQETTWSNKGIRDVLRYHAIGDGTKPANRIILAVEELKQKRSQNPKQWPDSIYQKELAKLKRGDLGTEKIPTLTVVIKPTDNSTFNNMIDALDEMQILSIGTYVIDKLNDNDLKILKEKNVQL